MKRPNGSGSIYKMSGKRRRPYAVRIFDGIEVDKNGNGKLKYKYLAYFEKQKDALQFLEKYNASPVTLSKLVQEDKKHRFSEIYEMYINDLENRSKKLSKQSFSSRNAAYNNLKPLHSMIFENLTLEDIENVVRAKSDMSFSSITNIKIVLKGMYKTAMRHRYVSEDLSALMIVDYSDDAKRPHTPFTDDEIDVLWKNQSDFYCRIYLILIYTGMRVNELLKMKSDDVHIDERYMVGGSKTKAGKQRKIPLSDKIIPFLDTSHEYLITKNGKRLLYDLARRESSDVLNSLGLPHNFHDTRHTCSTLLERAKIDKLHIKLILGHATPDITDRYTHIDIKDLIDDINRI